MKLFKKAKKGFTLVELVVVIAVIAILAGVSVGAYFGITESANNSKCEQEAKAFHTALMVVASDPSKGYTLDKTGIKWADDQDLSDLVTDITEQTGITYYVTTAGSDTNVAVVSETDDNAAYCVTISFTVAGKTKNIDVPSGKVSNPAA